MTEQQMTPIQYADQALAFADTKEKLTALAASSVRIVEITNKAGYQECHAARMALKTARVEIEKRGKDARADALAIQKAIIAKEKELVGLIEPEEQRLRSCKTRSTRRKPGRRPRPRKPSASGSRPSTPGSTLSARCPAARSMRPPSRSKPCSPRATRSTCCPSRSMCSRRRSTRRRSRSAP
jgi:hypothetical protein